MTDFLTAAQVAEHLGISRQRVHAFIKAGRLPAVKVGPYWLIEAAAVEGFTRLPSGRPKAITQQETTR